MLFGGVFKDGDILGDHVFPIYLSIKKMKYFPARGLGLFRLCRAYWHGRWVFIDPNSPSLLLCMARVHVLKLLFFVVRFKVLVRKLRITH